MRLILVIKIMMIMMDVVVKRRIIKIKEMKLKKEHNCVDCEDGERL